MSSAVGSSTFDAVFAVETLQHFPPADEWLFDELVRVTDGLLFTVENEADVTGEAVHEVVVDGEIPLYHRDWNHVFGQRGASQVAVDEGDRVTRRAFRVGESP